MLPIRLSFVTCNLWNSFRWEARRPALGQFLRIFRPDVLCVQELQPETRAFLDESLPGHRRVEDPFPGWANEGNIYWDDRYLAEVEHGAEDVGILEPERRLFWVRLRVKDAGLTLLVCTAHFTFKGNSDEVSTGWSPRVMQTRQTIESLDRLARAAEPVFFMGDLNDSSHPAYLLQGAGYTDCFTALSLQSPPTAPCIPTSLRLPDEPAPSQTLDWITSNARARPIAAQVPHFFYGDVTPSDHWPVQAVYEIGTDSPSHEEPAGMG
jgi:endonuclease/exonuclease/phosphatase family metal-dependent hydrolase